VTTIVLSGSGDWIAIRVDSDGAVARRRRTFLFDPEQTFAALAQALNLIAARWDIGAAHAFVLRDGRRVGPASHADAALDESQVKVGALLGEGDEFHFEIASNLRRRCRVVAGNTDGTTNADLLVGRRKIT
jgi:hypothetical protein